LVCEVRIQNIDSHFFVDDCRRIDFKLQIIQRLVCKLI
jgi:hypothetical protein